MSASTPYQPERNNKNVKLGKKVVKKIKEKIKHKQEMTSTVERKGKSKNSIKSEEPEQRQPRSNSGEEFMRKKRKQTSHETQLHSCDMQATLDQKKKTKSGAKVEENYDIKVSEKKSSKISSSDDITQVSQNSSYLQKNSEGDSTALLSTKKQRKRKKKNNSKKNKYKHLALNNKDTCAGDDLQASETAISQKNSKEILPQHIKDSSKDFQSCRNETEKSKTCKRKTKSTREETDINTDTQNKLHRAKKCDFDAAASSSEKLHGNDTDDDSYSSVSDFKDNESKNSGNLKNRKIKETNYSKEAETGDTLRTRTLAKSSSFLDKAREKLEAARFRFLNEQLYTSSGKEAFEMFKGDKESFEVYHKGFQGQVSRWPVNPLSTIVQQLKNK